MGASWNMLMIGKFRSFVGKPNPIDATKLGFLGRLFSLILVCSYLRCLLQQSTAS